MTTELTIHLPEPLLQEARQAAKVAKTSLEEFVSQAIIGSSTAAKTKHSHRIGRLAQRAYDPRSGLD